MKMQRHSGPQERVDLSFSFPSLEAPDAPKHVSADTVEESMQPIDRIFLSISAHHDALAPDTRVRTIYPRYLDAGRAAEQDGLTARAFRDGTPYSNEDLFFARTPALDRALHPRRRNAGHVPERAPHRRRRPDVSLSAELAGAMARRRRCDGPADGAVARTAGLILQVLQPGERRVVAERREASRSGDREDGADCASRTLGTSVDAQP